MSTQTENVKIQERKPEKKRQCPDRCDPCDRADPSAAEHHRAGRKAL